MKLFKNMDTDQYWLTLWTMIISAFIIMITIIGVSSYSEDVMVSKLVSEGHDPMELACLYNLSESLEASCIIISQAKAKVMVNAIK